MAGGGLHGRPALGLLIIRLGVGAMFLLHGWPKISGGPAVWERLGRAMGNLGVDFAPQFWGFMAGFAEFFGGAALLLGLLTRPAAALMAFTMLVAAVKHVKGGDGLTEASHAIELFFVFCGLGLLGPGRLSLDARLRGKG